MTKQVINKDALGKYIRASYEKYRKDNKDSLPTFTWRDDVEEVALKLVMEYPEAILRCAASMSGEYQRKLAKDSKKGVDTTFSLPDTTPTEPTLA